MNILLWVLQAALAFLYLAGGSFKVFKFNAVLSRYSLKVTAQNSMIWNLVIGLIAAFVAYGRYALSPLT